MEPTLLVVDGANVVGSVPDGWWRDRPGAAARLRDRLRTVAATGLPGLPPPLRVVLVVEGRARGVGSSPEVQVVAAAGSGDDAVVDVVRGAGPDTECVVVTADRGLRARVTDLGARVRGPRDLTVDRGAVPVVEPQPVGYDTPRPSSSRPRAREGDMAMTDSTTGRDVVDLIIEDHREIDMLFTELESGQGTPERRRELADVMIAQLVRHAEAEEAYVYPAARKALPDGNEKIEHELEEHAEAERKLAELDGMDPTDARFDVLVREIAATIRHHVTDEESDLLPRLRAASGTDEMVELGKKFEQIKKIVPTHPHPSAPDHAPLNKLLGPGVGLIDRVRDAMSKRSTTVEDLTDKSH